MRRALLLATLAVGASCGGAGSSGGGPANVLLVTLDTTRADYLRSYGSQLSITPVFDSLAAEGIRFANAASASAVTPVSHATILTGQFPYTHGLRVLSADSGARLKGDTWYLPQALADAGYSTAAVHSAFPVSGHFGFGRAISEFHDVSGALTPGAKDPEKTGWDMENLQRRADETTDLVLDVLERLEGPFFLWIHYWDPHDVMKVPPEEFMEGKGLTPDQFLRKEDETYAAEVDWIDQNFGRVLDYLRRDGRYDDTMVVVTSDHGEGLTDGQLHHGWRRHRMVYQEQIHVPLLVKLPKGVAPTPGLVVEEVVRTADIVPTILDYLDLPATTSFDGRSLRALIEGGGDEPRIAYADQINGYDRNAHMLGKRPDAAFLYMVSDGDWKLTYRPHSPAESELFRLSVDPDEVRNLFHKRANHRQRLLRELAERRPWVTAPFAPDGEGGPDVSDALGALGYAASTISDAKWVWTCPEHDELRLETEGPCPTCGSLPIPVQVTE